MGEFGSSRAPVMAPAGRYLGNDIDVNGDGKADHLYFQYNPVAKTFGVYILRDQKAGQPAEVGGLVQSYPANTDQTFSLPVDGNWGRSKTPTKAGFNGTFDQAIYFEFNGNHVENIRRDRVPPRA